MQSSSIACLPMMTSPGCSASAIALRIFATASGSTAPSALTRMPRSAPMASAVRMGSAACGGPIETATISVALPASLRRSASSTAISSNGFIDILTLPSSTPEPSALTRIFTSLSIARLTGTRIFIALAWRGRSLWLPAPGSAYAAVREPNGRQGAESTQGSERVEMAVDQSRFRVHAIEQLDARRPEPHEQCSAGDQAADMGPVGDAVLRPARHFVDLQDRPAADHPVGADAQRNEAEQAEHFGARPEQQIGRNDAGDRAGGADQFRGRGRIAQHESQAADDTTRQIKAEKAPVPQHLFDVVAEHEQEQHVAEHVHEVGMQEHRGDERERRPQHARQAAAGEERWNQSGKTVSLIDLVGADLIEEHAEIDRDEGPHHVWRLRPFERVVIP